MTDERSTAKKNRCAYCGSLTDAKYCERCMSSRMCVVHEMFGVTNGWDKRPHKKVEVKNGIRGRVVPGWKGHQNSRSKGSA